MYDVCVRCESSFRQLAGRVGNASAELSWAGRAGPGWE